MGKRNSSKTRICPAFQVIEQNPEPFFALLSEKFGSEFSSSAMITEIEFSGSKIGTGKEKGFDPNPKYLKWLLEHPNETEIERLLKRKHEKGNASSESDKKREQLVSPDKAKAESARVEGLSGIGVCEKSGKYSKKWFVLEGATTPDVFIHTDKFYLIIEGKRTEHRPERHTTWKRDRHQIVRHLEGLQLYVKQEKSTLPAYGIFIVEKADLENFNIYDTMEPFDKSLPHLNEKERRKIQRMFKGCLTWDEVRAAYEKCDEKIKYQDRID